MTPSRCRDGKLDLAATDKGKSKASCIKTAVLKLLTALQQPDEVLASWERLTETLEAGNSHAQPRPWTPLRPHRRQDAEAAPEVASDAGRRERRIREQVPHVLHRDWTEAQRTRAQVSRLPTVFAMYSPATACNKWPTPSRTDSKCWDLKT